MVSTHISCKLMLILLFAWYMVFKNWPLLPLCVLNLNHILRHNVLLTYKLNSFEIAFTTKAKF